MADGKLVLKVRAQDGDVMEFKVKATTKVAKVPLVPSTRSVRFTQLCQAAKLPCQHRVWAGSDSQGRTHCADYGSLVFK
jgi:hypothetical protein